MNNANNPTSVVIDLDGSLDELDDDDITLPDLASTPDIPIIETPRVEVEEEPEEVFNFKYRADLLHLLFVTPAVPEGLSLSNCTAAGNRRVW